MCCSGLAALCSTTPKFSYDLRTALQDPHIVGFDERLTNLAPDRAAWLLEQQGGYWARQGWFLKPGEFGELRLQLPASGEGQLKVRVWAYDAGAMTVGITSAGESYGLQGREVIGRIATIPGDCPCALFVKASNESAYEQLILDRVASTWIPSRSGGLPSLRPIVMAIILALGGWGILAYDSGSPESRERLLGYMVIVLATLAGFAERWALLDVARGLPLDPDAAGYVTFARQLLWGTTERGFFSGTFGEREPLHIGALNLWFQLWGAGTSSARWYTVMVSTVLIAGTGWFVWRVSGRWFLGGCAAFIMAFHQVWVEEAVRGLRLESMTLLILIVLSIWLWSRAWTGAILLGTAIGAMTLLQTPALSIGLGLIWGSWLVSLGLGRWSRSLCTFQHWRWFHLGLASCIAIVMLALHLYGIYQVHGDTSWPSYGYARWNANMEFMELHGSPGFPSHEEFLTSPYAGPLITYGQYLFGMHSMRQLFLGQLKGWIESTVYMGVSAAPDFNTILFLQQASGLKPAIGHFTVGMVVCAGGLFCTTLIGWLYLWSQPAYWWVPFMSIWGTWYVAYLYSVRLVEPFRHTAHIYPLLLFCSAAGVTLVIRVVCRRLGISKRSGINLSLPLEVSRQ